MMHVGTHVGTYVGTHVGTFDTDWHYLRIRGVIWSIDHITFMLMMVDLHDPFDLSLFSMFGFIAGRYPSETVQDKNKRISILQQEQTGKWIGHVNTNF